MLVNAPLLILSQGRIFSKKDVLEDQMIQFWREVYFGKNLLKKFLVIDFLVLFLPQLSSTKYQRLME